MWVEFVVFVGIQVVQLQFVYLVVYQMVYWVFQGFEYVVYLMVVVFVQYYVGVVFGGSGIQGLCGVVVYGDVVYQYVQFGLGGWFVVFGLGVVGFFVVVVGVGQGEGQVVVVGEQQQFF